MAQYKSVLTIISDAAMEIGIAQRPVSSVVDTQDQDIAQMRQLLYAVADEVLFEEPYRDILGDGNWIFDVNAIFKDRITSNDDRIAFDGRLATNGIKWRFLKAKGLEFGEEQRDFTNRMNKIAAQHNPKVLDLDLDWSVQQ